MLQYLTQPDTRFSIAEQCQMVIEGGCQWIQLHLSPNSTDEEIRSIATDLTPLCRETATILMIENKPELARELGLHGVHLTVDSGIDPIALRNEFGPEAIIGVEVQSVQDILRLKGADIDYVTLPPSIEDARREEMVRDAKNAGSEIPVVFEGIYSVDDVADALRKGASGVCTGARIARAQDPVSYTELMLAALKGGS